MTFVKLGVVLPLGSTGDFDDGRIYTANPLSIGGRVFLYYVGQDGATYRGGLAVSDDGVHFTRKGVVLPLGSSGDFDDEQINSLAPLLLDGRVFLYYTGYDGSRHRAGLAVSDDGVHFTKLGLVVPLGPNLDTDDNGVYNATPLLLDGRVFLYYTSYDGSKYRVALAVSDDGVHFTKKGAVLPLGAAGDWDSDRLDTQGPLLLDGRVYLYYIGLDGSRFRGGLAVSDDGVHFTKKGVVLPLGAGGSVDVTHILRIAPLFRDDVVFLYYVGLAGGVYRCCLAVSESGI